MRPPKKVLELIDEIYIELFKNSEPPVDYLKIKNTSETKKYGWWNKYYCPMTKQRRIIEDKLMGAKISPKVAMGNYWKRKIREEVALGWSPTTHKNEDWFKLNNKEKEIKK